MAFKDNFRIEKIYFQRVKDDAQILGSWKNDPRRYSHEEIIRVAKDACDSVLMLYRLLGECWNDALNQIEKLSAELEALAGKAEAYHDELNEKIDEVNNYLNTQIKNLEIRVENIENSIEDFGGLPSNENANEGDVLTKGENGNEWKKCNCLPPITHEDIGKVLGVIKDGETEPVITETIIAPLQNLTVTNAPVEITVDTDVLSSLQNGDVVFLSVNDKKLETVYDIHNGLIWEDTVDNVTSHYQIFSQGGQNYFIAFSSGQTILSGTYNVKCFLEDSVTYPIPKYAIVSPPYRFGPYVATTSENITMLADSLSQYELNAVYSLDYATRYQLPEDTFCEFYYVGHDLQESGAYLNCRGVTLPLCGVENDEIVIVPAKMRINNTDANNRILSPQYATVTFYCSVKLEEYNGE